MNRGDPYPAEVGATVQLVMQELGWSNPYRLVWQSKVGPMRWLEPDTETTIKGECINKYRKKNKRRHDLFFFFVALVRRGYKNLLLVPIAFVNDHIETLHELDIEYAKDVGGEVGAERIARCAAPNDHPLFVEALAEVVAAHLDSGQRATPQLLFRCPRCDNAACSKTRAWISKVTA